MMVLFKEMGLAQYSGWRIAGIGKPKAQCYLTTSPTWPPNVVCSTPSRFSKQQIPSPPKSDFTWGLKKKKKIRILCSPTPLGLLLCP